MGKSPQTFGGRGVNPDNFADKPHGMGQHDSDVAADGDPQPPQEHDDSAHVLDYLLSEDYRLFVNSTPSTPEDGDVVLNTDGSEVTLDVYDADASSFVGVGTSAESYTDADAVAALDAEVDNFASSVAALDDNTQSHASASNPHSGSLSTAYSAPVQDVNGETGSVNLNWSDVGALADHAYNPEADTHNPPTETQSERQGGKIQRLIDNKEILNLTTGETETATVDLSSGSFWTDEHQFNYNGGGSGLVEIQSYEITAQDGTVIYSEPSAALPPNEVKTIITSGSTPNTFQGTFENTSGSFDRTVSLDYWIAEPFLPKHNHQI